MSVTPNIVPRSVPNPPSTFTTESPASLAMKGYLLQQAIRHFADPAYIVNPALKTLLWKPDTQSITTDSALSTDYINSTILITTATAFRLKDLMLRPAVIVKSGDEENGPAMSIGDRWHTPNTLLGTPGFDPNHSASMGHREKIYMKHGSVTWFCIGTTPAQAEALGEEVYQDAEGFSDQIMEDLNLHQFRMATRHAVGILEECEERFVVPLVAVYSYTRSYIVRSEAPLLKRFHFSAQQTS